MKRFLIISFLLLYSSTIVAQLFEGSNGDGFDVNSKTATTLENISLTILYEGSNGDGFDVESKVATTLENISLTILYEGSNGDGFSNRILSATTLDNIQLSVLYEGSNGDGFSNRVLAATTLENISLAVLYEGSNGDGFSNRVLAATTLDNISLAVLYDGGNGDGFALRESNKNILTGEMITFMFAGGNGDGFSVDQESAFLDPNQIVDLRLNIKAFLQGPLINPTNPVFMNDALRVNNDLPTTSPYQDLAAINASVLNDGGTSGVGSTSDDIVDWVWVEIRSNVDNTLIVDGSSALIQRDGDIVALDGTSDVILLGTTNSYYIVVKHRNHLGVMTGSPINLSVVASSIDFTNASTSTFGNNAQVFLNKTTKALWAGDANNDGVVQYAGGTPDSPSILSFILNDGGNVLNLPTHSVSGYYTYDVDLNGTTQYSGANPDTTFILQNVLSHPGNSFLNLSTYKIEEQLPEN